MLRASSSGRWTTTRKVALVSFLGQLFFYIPALTPYLLARGLSLAQISGLQAILLLTQLVLEVPTGVVADRFGRRATLIAAAGAQALAELTFLLARDYPTFVVAQLIAGAGYALASGSKEALVYDSLPPGGRTEAMQQAMGLIGAATQAASVVAYLMGGALVATLEVGRISLAIGLTVVALTAAFGATLAIREPRATTGAGERRGSVGLLLDGLRLFRTNGRLRRIALLALLTNPFGWYLIVLYQAYFLQAGVAGGWFGPALAIGSLLGILGQRHAYALPKALGTRRGVLVATALPGAIYLLMAATFHPALAVLLFCAQWGATFVGGPLFAGYLNAHIPGRYRATALSLNNLLVSVYLVVMGPVIGRLADASLPAAFGLMGGLVLAGALALRIDDRHVAAGEASP